MRPWRAGARQGSGWTAAGGAGIHGCCRGADGCGKGSGERGQERGVRSSGRDGLARVGTPTARDSKGKGGESAEGLTAEAHGGPVSD